MKKQDSVLKKVRESCFLNYSEFEIKKYQSTVGNNVAAGII